MRMLYSICHLGHSSASSVVDVIKRVWRKSRFPAKLKQQE